MITKEYVNRAIDYILNHINDELSVEDIASRVNFSRFHFSRMFKAETGEGVFEFIKRVRLEQSAFRLKIERDKSITDIGTVFGYSSSNFSTSFKQHYDLSPVEFRRGILDKSRNNPFYGGEAKLETFEECGKKITLEMLEDRLVIYERHKGSYKNLSRHWCGFQEKYKSYITGDTKFLERTYNDPSVTDIDSCLYDICMTAPEDYRLENTYIMKGGKFACYHFKGPAVLIYTAYQSLFNIWLPQSGYEIDDRYDYDIYQKIDEKLLEMEIDFCIPVK